MNTPNHVRGDGRRAWGTTLPPSTGRSCSNIIIVNSRVIVLQKCDTVTFSTVKCFMAPWSCILNIRLGLNRKTSTSHNLLWQKTKKENPWRKNPFFSDSLPLLGGRYAAKCRRLSAVNLCQIPGQRATGPGQREGSLNVLEMFGLFWIWEQKGRRTSQWTAKCAKLYFSAYRHVDYLKYVELQRELAEHYMVIEPNRL